MIHIDYPNDMAPPREWLEKAANLTQRLKQAPDKESRDKIIDDNRDFWLKIREWLEQFSHSKCWFSEARDTCSYWQVEHFRPKKEAKDPLRDGYWWLAFDYRNFRLCGGVVNTKKGCYFPLRSGTEPASGPKDECDDESPYLIDPTRLSDVILLTFAEGGLAVPAAAEDGWHRDRALRSIERYKLNEHFPLLRARSRIWEECKIDVGKLLDLIALEMKNPSPSRRANIEAITNKLKARAQPKEQFSGVARAYLAQHPNLYVKQLLSVTPEVRRLDGSPPE
jgi:hypothetical protein